MPLSEPVSYHVKQKLTRVLSVFHATAVRVPITDSKVTYLSEHLSALFMQPGPGQRSSTERGRQSLERGIKNKGVTHFL